MIRIGVVGLGKMGLSHQAMINVHPDVTVTAVCDSTGYVLDVLNKYTGVRTFTDYDAMLRDAELDAVLIATPSRLHVGMVRTALERNLHVFCEKPLTLNPSDGEEITRIAAERGLITQVGYHYRFVGAFQEVKRLLEQNVIGRVSHVMAEGYGPVVLRPTGSTWRTQRTEGGGCLYDYAAHPINLVNWYFGSPQAVGGTVLNNIFSKETDDEVYGTLYFADGLSTQVSVNWSDESYRKMGIKLTMWGTEGKICADRQELQVFLRDTAKVPPGYQQGWNVRYTTDLTEPVWFYLRGEEYSAQLDYFVRCIKEQRTENLNSFESAAVTDRVIAMMITDAQGGARLSASDELRIPEQKSRWNWLRRWFPFIFR